MELKISDILAAKLETPFVHEKKPQADFRFTLGKVDEEGLAQRLSALLEDITAQGKKIAEHMDVADLKQYRGLITDFFNEVLSHSHKFSRENFLDRRGRHRVYGIVKLVDKNLDDLAQELLKNEKDHIAILDRVDEIRGLLLDLII
ncbi:MAG: YaaR family protein [Clostridiales bacterium]|jgi:uncharacterized protein YaaR (DUF327 family)|nr:YaaR family protein [Clostridiales bacterium]